MADNNYKDFLSRSKYVIKEGIFYIGDNREYEVIVQFVKIEEQLEDNTQKLLKIFFNDLRNANIEGMLKDKDSIIVTLLNRKILIKKSPYCLKKIDMKKKYKAPKGIEKQQEKKND